MSDKYTLADYVKGRIPDESLDRICKKADKLQQENLGRIADWSPDYEYDIIKCNKTPEEQREIMNELSDKQLKEIQEACLTSYQRGYREGYTDACKQIRGMVKTVCKSAEEALQKRGSND